MYVEMRTDFTDNSLVQYVCYYYLRRIVLAMTVVLLDDVLVIQFFIFIMSSIFQIILVGFIMPYKKKRHNLSEMINEVVTIFIMYHIFCFTSWVPDANIRYNIGYSCLVFNFLNLGFNLVQMLGCTLLDVSGFAKLIIAKRKFYQNRALQKARFNVNGTFTSRRSRRK